AAGLAGAVSAACARYRRRRAEQSAIVRRRAAAGGGGAAMTGADLVALLPLVVLSGAVILGLLAVALRRDHRLVAALSLLGLVLSCAALPLASFVAPRQVTPLLVVDGYALFFMGLLFAAGIAVVFLSYSYFAAQRGRREEIYILLLLSLLGAAALVS